MKKIPDFNPRAGQAGSGKSRRLGAFYPAGLDEHLGGILASRARRHGHPADRADRGQSLPAKTHCVNVEQVDPAMFVRFELGRGVAFQREPHIVRAHAAAIIFDNHPLQPALFNTDADRAGAGIEGILDQFLDRGRRAFNHFTRGNAIDRIGWQLPDHRTRGKGGAVCHLAKLGAFADSRQQLATQKKRLTLQPLLQFRD